MAMRYFTSIFFGHLYGLFGSPLPDAQQILEFSTCSDDTNRTLYRYHATGAQVMVWYADWMWNNPTGTNADIIASYVRKQGKQVDMKLSCSRSVYSLAGVRQRHLAVQAAAVAQQQQYGYVVPNGRYDSLTFQTAMGGDFFLDLFDCLSPSYNVTPPSYWTNISVVPFNQQIQALTQFAFVAYPVAFADRIALNATDAELWAFNHLWAVIGYAMGIDDQYNIALQPDLATAQAFYNKIFETFSLPGYFFMNRDFKMLAELTMTVLL